MKIRLLTVLLLAAALTMLISACGDSTETTTKSSRAEVPDPCELFSKEDAESILGEPVAVAETSGEGGTTRSCSYTTTGVAPRTATVRIVQPCSMADYMNYAESPLAEPVKGIGMHASWDKSVLLIHNESGTTCVYASGGGNPPGTDPADDQPALEQAKKVANMVLPKLP